MCPICVQKNYSITNLGPFHLFKLNTLHKFYQSYSPTAKLKILDIGSGPSIASAISAAPYAAEIVLSEYTEANRSTLLQWLNNDPTAFDWTHVFKHVVVDLEGLQEWGGSTNTSTVGAQNHQSCCAVWC